MSLAKWICRRIGHWNRESPLICGVSGFWVGSVFKCRVCGEEYEEIYYGDGQCGG